MTVVAAIRADGQALPPMCVVKGKTKLSVESFDVHLGPSNCQWTWQERGWMENSLGLEWFKNIFLANCSKERPVLLLLDSHSSHEVLEILELAKEEGIHIMALPPHTTQRLQPLDTNIFMPFKAKYNEACNTFMNDNPNKVIDKHSFPLMLSKAWEVFDSTELIKKSFKSTGIYPCNPSAINDDAFTPAEALSRPLVAGTSGSTEPTASQDLTTISITSEVGPVITAEALSRTLVAEASGLTEPLVSQELPMSSVINEINPIITFDDSHPSGSSLQTVPILSTSYSINAVDPVISFNKDQASDVGSSILIADQEIPNNTDMVSSALMQSGIDFLNDRHN